MPKKPVFQSLPDEAEHVAKAKKGDKEAYRILVEFYQDRVLSMVLSMVRQPHHAEDLVQEVFIKVFFALPKFKGDSAFYTWLFRIASNHCLDHLRKNRGVEVPLEPKDEDEERSSLSETLRAPETEHPETTLQAKDELARLLNLLEPDQKLLLSLREVEGHSYEELAEMLNCGVNTVKSRLNRAREALKEAYRGKYGNILGVENVQTSEGKTV